MPAGLAAGISTESIAGDHAVARHDDRHWGGPYDLPDRPRRHSSSTQRGEFPVGDRLSVTDCPQRLEDRLATGSMGGRSRGKVNSRRCPAKYSRNCPSAICTTSSGSIDAPRGCSPQPTSRTPPGTRCLNLMRRSELPNSGGRKRSKTGRATGRARAHHDHLSTRYSELLP
jgi:hypothetical protein